MMITYEQTDGEKALITLIANDAPGLAAEAVSLTIRAAYARGAFEMSVKHLREEK